MESNRIEKHNIYAKLTDKLINLLNLIKLSCCLLAELILIAIDICQLNIIFNK